MRILLTAGHELDREQARALLSGHQVLMVSTFEDAEHALVNYLFDAVVTDLLLPKPEREKVSCQHQENTGATIALLALIRGVEMVAIISKDRWHQSPSFQKFNNTAAEISCRARVFCTDNVGKVPEWLLSSWMSGLAFPA